MEREERECSSSSSSKSSSSTSTTHRTCRDVTYRRYVYEAFSEFDDKVLMGAVFDFGEWYKLNSPSLRVDVNGTIPCLVPRTTKDLASFNDYVVNLRFNGNSRCAHLGATIEDLEAAESSRGVAAYVMAVFFSLFVVLVIVTLVIYFGGERLFERSNSSAYSYSPTPLQQHHYGNATPPSNPHYSSPTMYGGASPQAAVVPPSWQPVGLVQPPATEGQAAPVVPVPSHENVGPAGTPGGPVPT